MNHVGKVHSTMNLCERQKLPRFPQELNMYELYVSIFRKPYMARVLGTSCKMVHKGTWFIVAFHSQLSSFVKRSPPCGEWRGGACKPATMVVRVRPLQIDKTTLKG